MHWAETKGGALLVGVTIAIVLLVFKDCTGLL